MKWNYDEALAQVHLKEYEKAVEKENAWRKRENKRTNLLFSLWVIGTAVVAAALIFLIHFLMPNDDITLVSKPFCVLGVCVLALVVLMFVALWFNNDYYDYLDDETRTHWRPMPDDAKYFLATNGKNVLSRDCKLPKKGFANVYVTLEDENHIVSKHFVTSLDKKISTAVEEEVVDVTNGVFLIPYSSLNK